MKFYDPKGVAMPSVTTRYSLKAYLKEQGLEAEFEDLIIKLKNSLLNPDDEGCFFDDCEINLILQVFAYGRGIERAFAEFFGDMIEEKPS
jgi:hypothetical protein